MNDGAVDVAQPHPSVQDILSRVEQLDLEVVDAQHFRDESVYLDGREFRNCSFERCKIFIKLGAFRLTGTVDMQESSFLMAQPAEAVQQFVHMVYEKQGMLR